MTDSTNIRFRSGKSSKHVWSSSATQAPLPASAVRQHDPPTTDWSPLTNFTIALTYRIINSLLVQTYYDPDEYWQSTEVIAPRLVQAVSASIGDYFTYALAYRFFGKDAARWAFLASLLSWYNFYAGVRTLSNTFETVGTVIALCYWPWEKLGGFEGTSRKASSLSISTVLDRLIYNQWTFVPYTFLHYNIHQNVSIFYGTHPWHWYITQGLPLVAFTFLAVVLYGTTRPNAPDRTLLQLVAWTVGVYSLISHKEFRFIMPTLPPLLAYAGECLNRINQSPSSTTQSWTKRPITRVMLGLVVTNGIMAYYFSRVHQRGVLAVMDWLRREVRTWNDDTEKGILFVMPCHSTPYYAYLHRNVTMRFITCEPPIK
ncbi:hypothetical protein HDV00_009852 [Rhizophlyctis rosea]|nr:hypothetical protein HDV00_009852 [Rhizophlyctis rosea]